MAANGARTGVALLAGLLACTFPAIAPADDQPPSPTQAYVAAVSSMRALATPPYVTYHSAWTSTGAGVLISQDGQRVIIQVGVGHALRTSQDYDIAFRTADRTYTVTTANGRLAGPGSRLLDPTWDGAYDILRYGLHGEPPTATPAPEIAASDAPSESATIAHVVAIAPAFYHVTDGGAGTCPSGNAAHVLTLNALRDPRAHPLTEVTVDALSGRFCSMRFNLNDTGVLGVSGDYEIHFAQSGSYWLVSGGYADLSARMFGIAARRVVLRWEYSAIATPSGV